MPLVCSTTKNGDISLKPMGVAPLLPGQIGDRFYKPPRWLSAGGEFSGPTWQLSQRHVDGTWQMAGRRSEFRLAHIDKDNAIADREAAL